MCFFGILADITSLFFYSFKNVHFDKYFEILNLIIYNVETKVTKKILFATILNSFLTIFFSFAKKIAEIPEGKGAGKGQVEQVEQVEQG